VRRASRVAINRALFAISLFGYRRCYLYHAVNEVSFLNLQSQVVKV